MALGNVIRLEGHWVHIIWGGTVDVLTHDERDGETDNQVVSTVYPYAEWGNRGERDIMIDVNEWCGSSAGREERLGSSSSPCKIGWDVDQIVPTSARFIPTRSPRYRANFNLRRRREEESGVINHPSQERAVASKGRST